MTAERTARHKHILVLGGSPTHRGGLEAYCERAVRAISLHAGNWQASWWPTDSAYLTPSRLGAMARNWRRLSTSDFDTFDLVWLQWSTLTDLLFLRRAKALGLPVMVTPHLGANARLQRIPRLRSLCRAQLAHADRLALLFSGQGEEVALPAAVPQAVIGTFLPDVALSPRSTVTATGPLSLLHAGRLGHGKGSFRMVALCAALRDRGIPFRARIVGRADPATMAELRQVVADAALGTSLTLIDWMDEAALIDALAETDVLVHLSELDSFPLIVLEALAAAAVPIVADMAGARAMVSQYGGRIATGADGGVAEAADWLAAQDLAELRERATEIAQTVRHDQAWERQVAHVIDVAEAALAGRVARLSEL